MGSAGTSPPARSSAPEPPARAESGPTLRVPAWLFAGLASAWSTLVLGAHFARFPIPLALAATDAAHLLAAVQHLTAGLLAEHLLTLACVLLIVAAAEAAGRGLLALLRVDALSAAERLLFAVALGFGALSHLMLLMAAVGRLTATMAWLVVGALAAAGLPGLVAGGARAWRRRRERRRTARWPALDVAAACVLGLQAAITLLFALGPLIFYDALTYHFSAPRLAILNGTLLPLQENLLARLPAAGGSLYALSLLLRDEIAAKLLCWLCGVGVVAAVGLLARRMAWKGVGLWGALICATLFHFSQAATAGGVDLQLALYSACAVFALLIYMEADGAPARPAPLLVLSAIFCGLAIATKYTGALLLLSLAATLLLTRRRRGAACSAALRDCIRLLLIAGAAFSPWLIRNVLLYGNPVAPLLPRLFSGSDAALIERTEAFVAEAAQHGSRSWVGILALPWDITMGAIDNSPVFSPLFLLLLPLIALFKGFPGGLRRCAVVAGVFALGWSLVSTQVRFLLPALPWLGLLSAYWVVRARLAAPLRLALQGLILACCVAGLLVSFVVSFPQEGWKVVLGVEARPEYLSRSHPGYTHPSYGMFRWIDAHLPATARVLLVGETRGYYLERDFVANSPFDRSTLLDWAERSAGPDELRRRLESEGITHLLLNPAEARRLQPYGMLRTTSRAKHTLQEFWRLHLRQVAAFDELSAGRGSNRVTLHALGTHADGAAGMPGYFAGLIETP